MTYVLENIPDHLERALRERAAAEHKSPEAVIVDLLSSGLNASSFESDCASSAESRPLNEDAEFAMTLREQRLIDWEAWSDGIKRRDLSGIAGERLITPEMKSVFQEQRRIDPELWK